MHLTEVAEAYASSAATNKVCVADVIEEAYKKIIELLEKEK